jgi:hypothetical protein
LPDRSRKYGRDEKLFTWRDELTADCPCKRAGNINDQCGDQRSGGAF